MLVLRNVSEIEHRVELSRGESKINIHKIRSFRRDTLERFESDLESRGSLAT